MSGEWTKEQSESNLLHRVSQIFGITESAELTHFPEGKRPNFEPIRRNNEGYVEHWMLAYERQHSMRVLELTSHRGLGYQESLLAYALPGLTLYVRHPDDSANTQLVAISPRFDETEALNVIWEAYSFWLESAAVYGQEDEDDEMWDEFEDEDDEDDEDAKEGWSVETCLSKGDGFVRWLALGMPPLPINEKGNPYVPGPAEDWDGILASRA